MSTHPRETREERAARYERGDFDLALDAEVFVGTAAAVRGRALMDEALDPAELAEPARLTRGGRPSIGADVPSGESRQRNIRFPADLDRALVEGAAQEHQDVPAIVRAAVGRYLQAS